MTLQQRNDRERLRQQFDRAFAYWKIKLPAHAMSPGEVWFKNQRGWSIWVRLDVSAENERLYLDYYAWHRMTDDRHVRLHASGKVESLPSGSSMYGVPKGATEKDREDAQQRHIAHNKSVSTLMKEKGFNSGQKVPGGPTVGGWKRTRPSAGYST